MLLSYLTKKMNNNKVREYLTKKEGVTVLDSVYARQHLLGKLISEGKINHKQYQLFLNEKQLQQAA